MRAVSVSLPLSILSIIKPQYTALDYTGVTPAIHNGFLFERRTSERASDAQSGREGPKLRQEGRTEGKKEEGRRKKKKKKKKKLLEMVLGREGFAKRADCWYSFTEYPERSQKFKGQTTTEYVVKKKFSDMFCSYPQFIPSAHCARGLKTIQAVKMGCLPACPSVRGALRPALRLLRAHHHA